MGQILVMGCRKHRVSELYDPKYNLRVSAEMQEGYSAFCESHTCQYGWLWFYNHSAEYVRSVQKKAEEVRHAYEEAGQAE